MFFNLLEHYVLAIPTTIEWRFVCLQNYFRSEIIGFLNVWNECPSNNNTARVCTYNSIIIDKWKFIIIIIKSNFHIRHKGIIERLHTILAHEKATTKVIAQAEKVLMVASPNWTVWSDGYVQFIHKIFNKAIQFKLDWHIGYCTPSSTDYKPRPR